MDTLQPPDNFSARVIESYGALIESPAARLKFIRRAVARCEAEGVGTRARWPLAKRFFVRKIVVEELVPLLPDGRALPTAVRLAFWTFKLRVPIYVLSLCAALAVLGAVGYAAVGALEALSSRNDAEADAAAAASADAARPREHPVADPAAAYAPEQIWLVEAGDGFELYSNGARVLTEFETEGPPRRFFAFPRAGGGGDDPGAAVEHTKEPVGIVYHTSQSHIAPFSAEYNQKLQSSSRAVLEYVRDKKLYNYLIDRFGRVYRIVKDESVADHAGNSVWRDDASVYVNLSDAFLGVCFEASWSPDTRLAPDEINEAQVYAGRALTAMLRSRYRVDDANCVTHALVSVSPASRLVGFHMDWAKAFPFAAMGLSDKYAVETPSVAEFGFDHDASFDRVVGANGWPGIALAESAIERRASETGVKPAAVRREMQERFLRYRSWLASRGAAGESATGGG